MLGKGLRTRPGIATALAVLAICTGLVLGVAAETIARTRVGTYTFGSNASIPPPSIGINWMDSDRSVPEYHGVIGTVRDKQIGYTAGYYYPPPSGSGVVRWIQYDKPAMDYIRRVSCGQNGGSRDWTKLRAHERAHSRGWDHGQAPKSSNAAYYGQVFSYNRNCG